MIEPPAPGSEVPYLESAERLLHEGAPVLALNAAEEGLRLLPQHPRLRQLQALALVRSGDVERANRLLNALAETASEDVETLGLLARTHKDLALGAADVCERERHGAAALKTYADAFALARAAGSVDGALYAGINAAAMAVLRGDPAGGRALAREVQALCSGPAAADDYWRVATQGEAALILGEHDAAAAHYARASALAGRRFGDIASTRRQARLLAAALGRPVQATLAALRIPPVLMFSGHMIDAPGRARPRFPAGLEDLVRERLRAHLARLGPLAAYGSAASGADILCLELAHELGCDTHVVLPFPAADFRRISVDGAGGDWGARFERVLARASSVTVASDHVAQGSSATFEYANLILTGMAALHARNLDTEVRGLALCDPREQAAPGGTGSLVALWRQRGIVLELVDPALLRGAGVGAAAICAAAPVPVDAALARHEMRSLLFADAIGYSQLTENQTRGFIAGYLDSVARLHANSTHRCEHVETSGDGLYMVFADARDAGGFALELSAMMRQFDRAAWGLPPDFDLRIALHSGPVHCARNPLTGGALYTGPHTSRAARIEPVTPPGQVYGSAAFAAVAAASGADGLSFLYVGRIPLAKGYGDLAVYSVRAR